MYRSHRVWNEIFVFFKRHIIICTLCLVSAFIIAKNSHIPAPSWLPTFIRQLLMCPSEETTGAEWLVLFSNISLAYIGSIITYLVVQYIPERKRAYKAFSVFKKEICGLYSYMSRLIAMYLFEIEIQNAEESLSEDMLSPACYVEISDSYQECGIRKIRNGKFANVIENGYNLFRDSMLYFDLICKSINQIKGTICSGFLDQDILDILSIIENNWFLVYFSYVKSPYIHKPGYKCTILNFDKGLYEFIRCHISLRKYSIDLISYEFTKISNEEMVTKKENNSEIVT